MKKNIICVHSYDNFFYCPRASYVILDNVPSFLHKLVTINLCRLQWRRVSLTRPFVHIKGHLGQLLIVIMMVMVMVVVVVRLEHSHSFTDRFLRQDPLGVGVAGLQGMQ